MSILRAIGLGFLTGPACQRCNDSGWVPGFYQAYETKCPDCNGGVDEAKEFRESRKPTRKQAKENGR